MTNEVIAMELLIKQRVFSWTDSYDVYDETGTPKYFVKADFFSFGHQIHIFDKQTGVELGSVHQKLFTLLPTFELLMNGRTVGLIRKRFALFRNSYEVEYRGWDVEGDFLGWDYEVIQGDLQIMSISKQWLSWGDTYTLRYSNPANEFPGLLLVIAIDAANCTHDD